MTPTSEDMAGDAAADLARCNAPGVDVGAGPCWSFAVWARAALPAWVRRGTYAEAERLAAIRLIEGADLAAALAEKERDALAARVAELEAALPEAYRRGLADAKREEDHDG